MVLGKSTGPIGSPGRLVSRKSTSDLIAGWWVKRTKPKLARVRRTLEMEPDSVTVYQMEIPYNTTVFQG